MALPVSYDTPEWNGRVPWMHLSLLAEIDRTVYQAYVAALGSEFGRFWEDPLSAFDWASWAMR